MDVSPVRPDEYASALELWEASVRATHHFVADTDIEIFRPMVRDAFPEIEQLVGVRDDSGTLLGFAGVVDGKVEMLFVDPDHRGRGLGTALLDHAVATYGATTLDVNEQNEQAVGFYLHYGFEVTGRSDLDGTGKPYPLLQLRLVPGGVGRRLLDE